MYVLSRLKVVFFILNMIECLFVGLSFFCYGVYSYKIADGFET